MKNSSKARNTHTTLVTLRINMQDKKQHYNWAWNSGLVPNWKEYVRGSILSPVTNLTIQTTSSYLEMQDRMTHKLGSRLLGKYQCSDMQMIPPSWLKAKRSSKLLIKFRKR